MKLSNEALMYINNIIDMRTPLTDSDFEFITGNIILATPPAKLPSIDEITDHDMKLTDMLAGYMKTLDPDKGQDILDYMANNAVKYFMPTIKEILDERYENSIPAHIEREQNRHQQEYSWNKNRI
jgi:hypothetical protein